MSTLARHSTRAPVSHDSSVPVAVASALLAAGVTWALKPGGTRDEQAMILPEDLNDDTKIKGLDPEKDVSSSDSTVPELSPAKESPSEEKLQDDPKTPLVKEDEAVQVVAIPSGDHVQVQATQETDAKPVLVKKFVDLSSKGKGVTAKPSKKLETAPEPVTTAKKDAPKEQDSNLINDVKPVIVENDSKEEGMSMPPKPQEQAPTIDTIKVEGDNNSAGNGKSMWF